MADEMEKHQRKNLFRWELRTARELEKYERRVRDFQEEHSHWRVCTFLDSYIPPETVATEGVVIEARALWATLPPRPSEQAYADLLASIDPTGGLGRFFVMWNGPDMFYRYTKKRSRYQRLDVSASFDAVRNFRDAEVRTGPLRTIVRSIRRSDTIREELLADYRRRQAIRTCKILKEEIMMAAWHPRRVEHILTTYGWEAWDNLLGLE